MTIAIWTNGFEKTSAYTNLCWNSLTQSYVKDEQQYKMTARKTLDKCNDYDEY